MNVVDKAKAMQAKYGNRGKSEKRPRHFAEEILQLKTKEERRAALEQVPEEMRGLVRAHVEAAFEKMKYHR